MKISVFGSGYVGLVTGACFADFGNQVTMIDVDESKIAALRQGEVPIFEPGLEEMLQRNKKAGRILYTTSAEEGLSEVDVIFVAVSTPEGEDGRADLKFVEEVAKTVARLCAAGSSGTSKTREILFVLKSTVPVGTADRCRKLLPSQVIVVNNPEFLKEGSAIADFLRPERVVIGTDSEFAKQLMSDLYQPFVRSGAPILNMGNRSAELAKYAANSFLALKVSFINQLALLAEEVGADVYDVRSAMITDSRIGRQFLHPGAGYGGSCFPKDVLALASIGKDVGLELPLVEATHEINERQRHVMPSRILSFLKSKKMERATIALWGVAFKPETDDIREAPALILIDELVKASCTVRVYDPQALKSLAKQRAQLVKDGKVILCSSAVDALNGADLLVVMTEWNEFRTPDFALLAETLKHKVIFDGKNLYRENVLLRYGLHHYGIGFKKFRVS